MLAISFQICQSSPNSNYVFRDPAITPSNESIITLINFASELGMSTFLKPLVLQNGSDSSFAMADVNPSNNTLWFESYSKVMLEFAELSENVDVSMICVGLELEQVSSSNTAEWISLIQKIRQVYSGKLSYCSDTLSGETEAIQFWSELDYIGLDIYVPLVNPFDPHPDLQPPLSSMQAEFDYIWNVGFYDWYASSPWINVIPLFITETGYPSSNGGLQTPYEIPSASKGGCTGIYSENQTVQVAALEVLSTQLRSYMINEQIVGMVYFNFDDRSNSWYQNKTNGTFACSWSPVDKSGYVALRELFSSPNSIPASIPTVIKWNSSANANSTVVSYGDASIPMQIALSVCGLVGAVGVFLWTACRQ